MRGWNAVFALLILGCSSNSAGGGAHAAGTSGNGSGGSANGAGGSANTVGTDGPITYGGAASCGMMTKGGSPGGSGGAVDMWTNVTPAGINLQGGADNFGVQDVLADPVRPSDLYAFVCHQGVWKSTDFGQTWGKVNTGDGGAMIDSGKPWGEAIDPNKCRDPNTPPALFSAGSQGGFWKSTDGGVSWTESHLPVDGKARPDDDYDIDVDPYDSKHLIVGFHEQPGLAESHDGGDTFTSVKLDPGMMGGISYYGFFIDTGDPVTTAKVWLLIPEAADGGVGTWRTQDGGTSWKQVSKNEHNHGQSQIYQKDGVVFMAGVYAMEGWGVLRSMDLGVTWTHLGTGQGQGVLYGTATNIYAQNPGASSGLIDQTQSERAAQPGDTWTVWPLTMTNGPKRAAVTNDGAHYIVVGGNWNAGIWRYVEP
jgi:hypothetical protein